MTGTGSTLLAIEVDRWRLVRDLLGTDAAAVVMRHVEQCVEASLRPSDRWFHTSPGQFLVVLEGADHAHAERLAAQIGRAIEAKSFKGLGHATISGAVAQRYPSESMGQWWKRVDSTLAQARAGGGGCVVVDRRSSDSGPEHAPGLHLEWQPRFECGEPVIDRQHRELFEQAEEVLDTARHGDVPLAPRVSALVREIDRHFATEEGILAHHGYRGLEYHAQAHAQLAAKARRMLEAMQAGRTTREDLLRFLLGEVVADHMLAEDRLFAELFARPLF